MSTQIPSESRHASSAETTVDPDLESDSPSDDEPAPIAPFDAHNSAASFDAENTDRLPNTVDGENERIG